MTGGVIYAWESFMPLTPVLRMAMVAESTHFDRLTNLVRYRSGNGT